MVPVGGDFRLRASIIYLLLVVFRKGMRYSSSWKQHQAKENRKSIFSIFLTIVLLFAIISGLSKGFSLSSKLKGDRWDGVSPFVVAIGSSRPAVFVFGPDSKKIVVLSVGGEILYESGNSSKPLAKISDAGAQGTAEALSKTFGAKIDNYIAIKNNDKLNEEKTKEMFKSFASLTTPLAILTKGYGDEIQNTNITRLDALRLWWKLKGLGVKDVDFSDLSLLTEEILDTSGQKVLGADTVSLNRQIEKYLQNSKLSSEAINITIKNGTGVPGAARLAASFATSVGAKVVDVKGANALIDKTSLVANEGSFTASYLAKMFKCDINVAQNSTGIGEITIDLGQDFARYWFK